MIPDKCRSPHSTSDDDTSEAEGLEQEAGMESEENVCSPPPMKEEQSSDEYEEEQPKGQGGAVLGKHRLEAVSTIC